MYRIRFLEDCRYVMMSLVAMVFILSHEIDLSSANSITFDCTEPTDVNMWNMYRKFREHELETGQHRREVKHVTHNATATQNTIVNTSCQGAHHHTGKMCACRSKEEITFDPERIPKAIAQSSCCSSQSQPSPDSIWVTDCINVYQEMRVFRRNGCKSGVYTYELRWENVPIGCSCFVGKNTVSERD